MKVSDILSELRHSKTKMATRYWKYDKETGKGTHVPDGFEEPVVNFYKPGFRQRSKVSPHGDILGTIGDWLAEMGATKADIAPAREAVVASPEYKRIMKAFSDITTEGEKKAGTISLKLQVGNTERDVIIRKVHANGTIRTHARNDLHHAGRGTTLHPWTVKTHPNLTGQQRIEGSMKQSLDRLYEMYRPRLLKAALNKLSPKYE